MLAENLSYLTAFIATSGITVISILISYQLTLENKKPELQILLYQQIFLFSFFIFSIWGNLAIRQVIADVNLNSELIPRLVFFIPLPGMPFLMISWFMLLKFSLNINGYHPERKWIFIYFTGFIAIFAALTFLFHTGKIETPINPDKFLLRVFVCLNLVFHLLFLLPFLKSNIQGEEDYKKKEMRKCLSIYITATAIQSMLLWFSVSAGFLLTVVSILLLFSSSALLPVSLKLFVTFTVKKPINKPVSFEAFCNEFHISKREAEIVLEICAGKTNKAIADKLFITLQTVKDHTHRIYTKTNVKSRVQLANLVLEKAGKK
jgi:DNA-binding CsgD family transcriptional regulator